MKNVYYLAGIFCGIALVALIYLISTKTMRARARQSDFDERQLWIRGRAYRTGFFSLIIACFVYGLADAIFDMAWCETVVGLAACVCLSIVIWASICVWHDAYFKISESPRHYKILFGCVSLGNIAIGVSHMLGGDFIEDGRLGINSLNFIAGIMLLAVFIVTIVKDIKDRRENE